MKTDDAFTSFYSLYRKHGGIIGKFEKDLRKKLKDKLSSRMRDKLIGFNSSLKTLGALKAFCQKINDEQRRELARTKRINELAAARKKCEYRTYTPTSRTITAQPTYNRPPVGPVSILARPPANNLSTKFNTDISIQQGPSHNNCFNCGKPEHIVKDCPEPKRGGTGIHEIHENVGEKDLEKDPENV